MSCRQIRIERLCIDLDGPHPKRLVDDLTLTMDAGRSLAVVGESGAGKSMTALAVMGLLPKGIRRSGGEITVNDAITSRLDAEGWRRLRNRQVAMILQNPMSAFDPVFTIGAHFHETSSAHYPDCSRADAEGRAGAALREVGFDDPESILSIYPFQMSGGMLQRVMIALALATDPDFLIADEATTDLDVRAQATILRLLAERRRERHLGLLIITHDLSVAAEMADRTAVMHNGRLLEIGSTAEIFAQPSHPYTAQLLAAHRRLYGKRFNRIRSRLEREGAK